MQTIRPQSFDDALLMIRANNPEYIGLKLDAQQLNDDHVIELCEALSQNPSILSLYLSCNDIGLYGVTVIPPFLTVIKSRGY